MTSSRGQPFAVLKVEEVYKLPDRREFADAVIGTPERNGEVAKRRFDEKHSLAYLPLA